MTSRRSLLNRLTAWTAAAVLMLALYLASVPLIGFWSTRHATSTVLFVRALYAPASVYSQHHRLPGSIAYNRYQSWCENRLANYFAKDPLISKLDNELCDIQFSDTSLNQVADFLSTLHECPFELDPSANPEIPITASAKAPLRDVLEQLLKPHGLVAAPIEERIVIGTPDRINQLTANSRPGNPLIKWAVGLLSLLALIVAILIFRRRNTLSSRSGSA